MSRKVEISFQTLISNLKINLEEEKACRICAAKGVKMYDLHTHPWGGYFETITGISPLVDISHNACYQCAALMRKYYLFRQKCLHRQSMFYEYFSSNIEDNSVDFDQKAPNFNLSVCNIPPGNIYKYVYDEREDTLVKEEITYVDTNVKSDEIFDQDEFTLQSSVNSSADDDEPIVLSRPEITNNIINEENGSPVHKTSDVHEKSIDIKSEVLLTESDTEDSEIEVNEPKIISLRSLKVGPISHREDIEMAEYCQIIKLSKEEQMEEIKQRQNTRNYKGSPYKCDMCYKGFIDSRAFQNHMRKHDPAKGDLECPVCRFRFPKRYLLLKHATNHDKKYICKKCDYVSTSKDQAIRHEKWHKGVTYKCKYCEEVLTKWTSYMSHMRIKHPSAFICGDCGNSFVSRLGLSIHKSMMHKDNAKMNKESTSEVVRHCKECDVKFTSLEAWKRHLVVSNKHEPKSDIANRCRHCGDIFNSKEALRTHCRNEHPPTRVRKRHNGLLEEAGSQLKCQYCDELFGNGREFWNHFRRSHPDKKYPIDKSHICEICGKGFTGSTFLKYHMLTHSDERSYKCGQCPKAFFKRDNLQKHEKTHSEHRAYSCNVCLKAFKLPCSLYRHHRIHTGVKPYKCELCGKAFNQSNSRKLHVRTVHLKEPAPYISKSRLKRRRGDRSAPSADAATPPSARRRRRTTRAQDAIE